MTGEQISNLAREVAHVWGLCGLRVAMVPGSRLQHVSSKAEPDKCSWCGEPRR